MKPTLARLTIADDPAAWSKAGFTVEDGQTMIDGVALAFTNDTKTKGIVAWALTGVETATIDGLPTEEGSPNIANPTAPGHPNGAAAIDHVVASSPNLPRTIEAFAQYGIEASRTRDTDSYGAPMRQVFFRLGRPILEFIGPPESSGDEPSTFFGLALNVGDLDATRDLLGDGLSDPKEAVQPGRLIATLRHKEFGITVPIAFMST